jgi:competence protein ComEC
MRAVCAAVLLVLAQTANAAATPPPVDVYFFDVGHGDAILVQQGKTEWLIDSGYQNAWDAADVSDCSSLGGVTIYEPIEHFIFTHDDEDHYSALPALLEACDVQTLSSSVVQRAAARLDTLCQSIAASAPARDELQPGIDATPVLGGNELVWRVLYPSAQDVASGGTDNGLSLVLLLSCGAVHFLFTGDLERVPAGVSSGSIPSGVLIIKAPHHGYEATALAGILSALAGAERPRMPDLVVFSTDVCAPPAAASLPELGIPFLNTRASGTVRVHTDGQSVWATTEALAGRPILIAEP